MQISVENLGKLTKADFSLGDLSIICGENNMGKTYATYALFGFLHTWRNHVEFDINDGKIFSLLNDGSVSIDLKEYLDIASLTLEKACISYTKKLPDVFASNVKQFKGAKFQLFLDKSEMNLSNSFHRTIRAANTELFVLDKDAESTLLLATLVTEKDVLQIPQIVIKRIISEAIVEIVFAAHLPRPFISSAERTGAAIFRNELNFARNRLLEELRQRDTNVDPMDLLMKSSPDYALAVEENVDFTRQLETIFKQDSEIFKRSPEVLESFAHIIGGEYEVDRNNDLFYKPKGTKVKLTMDASSSAVRSLLDIGFYLRHVAKPGDLLMIDEPELNLHPKNQRLIARLFASLTKLGIKVFITTHSDFIVKEINTLIMLNQNKPYLKELADQEKYLERELLSCNQVKLYIAEVALVKVGSGSRRINRPTLVEAVIDSELGIDARCFDETIDDMNRIQDAILWGEPL